MILGFILVTIGVLILALGDKKLNSKGGKILKTVSASPLQAKVIKWAIGLLLIWFGAALFFGRG